MPFIIPLASGAIAGYFGIPLAGFIAKYISQLAVVGDNAQELIGVTLVGLVLFMASALKTLQDALMYLGAAGIVFMVQ